MALVFTDNAESLGLKALLNHTAQSEDLSLRLFKNNFTPTETCVTASFTVADFTGYSNKAITGSSFTISGTATNATYAQQTFQSTADQSSQDIYGYFVVRDTTGDILWAELFSDGPYAVANSGDEIKVTLNLDLS